MRRSLLFLLFLLTFCLKAQKKDSLIKVEIYALPFENGDAVFLYGLYEITQLAKKDSSYEFITDQNKMEQLHRLITKTIDNQRKVKPKFNINPRILIRLVYQKRTETYFINNYGSSLLCGPGKRNKIYGIKYNHEFLTTLISVISNKKVQAILQGPKY
jgi:hypothetical protein